MWHLSLGVFWQGGGTMPGVSFGLLLIVGLLHRCCTSWLLEASFCCLLQSVWCSSLSLGGFHDWTKVFILAIADMLRGAATFINRSVMVAWLIWGGME